MFFAIIAHLNSDLPHFKCSIANTWLMAMKVKVGMAWGLCFLSTLISSMGPAATCAHTSRFSLYSLNTPTPFVPCWLCTCWILCLKVLCTAGSFLSLRSQLKCHRLREAFSWWFYLKKFPSPTITNEQLLPAYFPHSTYHLPKWSELRLVYAFCCVPSSAKR